MAELEYITNNKGGQKLIYVGHQYTKKSVSQKNIRWECSKRIAKHCGGKLTVCIDSGMIISSIPHTHAASQADVRVTKVKIALKRKIADTAVTGCSKQTAISESRTTKST